MTSLQHLDTPQGRRLAFCATPGTGPWVVFLSGLRSDMEGTKAVHLEAWAQARGHAFLRFDYSGHGGSSGTFEDGCIGDWAEDTAAILAAVATGPVVLVGSSMGGWQALLASRPLGSRLAGLVTIAAAPDFTEDGMWASFSEIQQTEVMEQGQTALPSEYGDPLIVTRRMIEDGRQRLVLRSPLVLNSPTRFLQGTADVDVDMSVALRLLDHATGPDIRLTLVDGADHRFSSPDCLDLLTDSVEQVLARAQR